MASGVEEDGRIDTMSERIFNNKNESTNDEIDNLGSKSFLSEIPENTKYIIGGVGAGVFIFVVIAFAWVINKKRIEQKMETQESIDENPDYGETYYEGNTQILDKNSYYYM